MDYIFDVYTPTQTANGTLRALADSFGEVARTTDNTMVCLVMREAEKACRDALEKV